MSQIVYITVRLELADNCDPTEVVSECDYNFNDEEGHILDSEIIDIEDKL